MAVIQGTEGADNLVGTAADDQIYGRGGDDVLNGGDGNDILFGGIGADRLIGGAGTDTASYEDSNSGGVTLNFKTGVHTGLAAGDTFQSIEIFRGSNYDDTFVSDATAHTFVGANGTDTLDYSGSAQGINLTLDAAGAGTGAGGDAEGDKFSMVERFIGTSFNDTFTSANNGFIFEGGAGNDVYVVNNPSVRVVEQVGGGDDEVRTSLGSYSLGVNVERLTYTGTGTFAGYGNSGDNIITGGNGNDTLFGGLGADQLIGGAGIDSASYEDSSSGGVTLNFKTGVHTGLAAGDTFQSIEIFRGSNYDDTFVSDATAHTFVGANGTDTLDYSGSAQGINLTLDAAGAGTGAGGDAEGDKFSMIERFIGTSFNDTFTSANNGFIFEGGAGNDVYVVNNPSVRVVEQVGGGDDEVRTSLGSYSLGVNVERLTYTGTGTFAGYGNSGDNIITGGNGNDTLFGGLGADQLIGGAGIDSASYEDSSSGGVTLNFKTGVHTGLAAGDTFQSIEIFRGSNYDDTFVSDATAHTFVGANGTDTLDYSGSAQGINLTLDAVGAGTGAGGDAEGDKFSMIERFIGTSFNDTFTSANNGFIFEGGAGNDVYVVNNPSVRVVEQVGGGDDEVRTSLGSYSLGVNVERLTYTGTGTFAGYGNSGDNIITGGNGNDTLFGGLGADQLIGGAGIDSASYEDSSSGGVTLNFKTGVHTGLAAGDTYDSIEIFRGSNYDDTFVSDATAHTFVGANGTDTLDYSGSAQAISLTLDAVGAGTGAGGDAEGDKFSMIERFIGTSFNDTFTSANNGFIFEGGAGNDVYVVNNPSVRVVEQVGGGDDEVRTSLGSYSLGVNVERLTYTGTGTFAGYGNSGDNIITGGNGNDTLFGGLGADQLIGGAGIDSASYEDSSSGGVTLNFKTGVHTGLAAGDTFQSIEIFRGSNYDDTFVSDATAHTFVGANGTDTLDYSGSAQGINLTLDAVGAGTGAGGDAEGDKFSMIERFIGTSFNDTFTSANNGFIFEGGAGNDVYVVNNPSVRVVEQVGGGDDEVRTSLGSYSLGVNVERLTYTGTGTFAGYGNSGDNIITGGNGNDTLFGGLGADQLIGGAGIDSASYEDSSSGGVTLNFKTGVHTGLAAGDTYDSIEIFRGSNYDDTFVSDATAHTFVGANGTDTLDYSGSAQAISLTLDAVGAGTGAGGDAEGDKFSMIERFIGTSFNDTFTSANNGFIFEGGAGNDVYVVNNPSVRVVEQVGGGDDEVRTSLGSYSLAANVERLTYTGTGTFAGYGNSGDNIITGGNGNDTLFGGFGADQLIGGAGIDSASYEDSSSGGVTLNFKTGVHTGLAAGDTYDSIEIFRGSNYDDTFVSDATAHTFVGANGTDTLDYSGSAQAISLTLDAVGAGTGAGGDAEGDKFSMIERFIGTSFNDTFTSANNGFIFEGGAGNDVYVVNNPSVRVVEQVGGGDDEVRTSLGSYSLAANVERLTYTGTGTFAGYGNSGDNIITGGNGNDTLFGGFGADQLIGGAGIDSASYEDSSSGGVTLNFKTGVHTGLAAGDTYDSIEIFRGSNYDDTFVSDATAHTFVGANGTDTLDYSGSAQAISLTLDAVGAGTGAGGDAEGDKFSMIERFIGTSFNDTFTSANNGFIFEGGAGNDVYVVNNPSVRVVEQVGGGDDEVRTSLGSYSLAANVERLTYTGTGTFAGYGNSGDNIITGGNGNDTLFGGFGADQLIGGAGIDSASYEDSSSGGVTLNFKTGVHTGLAAGDTYDSIEIFRGSNYDDTFVSDATAHTFVGANGTDTLDYSGSAQAISLTLDAVGAGTGAGGDAEGDKFSMIERFIGTSFSDTFTSANNGFIFEGGAGNDVYVVNNPSVRVVEQVGGGDDEVRTSLGSYSLAANVERLTYTGTGAFAGYGNSGDNIITGGNGNDTLFGGLGADQLIGGAGIDTASYMDSNAGVSLNFKTGQHGGYAEGDTFVGIERFMGSNGADSFVGGAGADYFDGAGGTDLVSFASESEAIVLDLTKPLTGAAAGDTYLNIEAYEGTAFNDTFIGTAANENFIGGAGADVINGGAGKDAAWYVNSAAGVSIDLAAGTAHGGDAEGDVLSGIEGLAGSAFDDVLNGDANSNTLFGAEGNDVINGGAGNDFLYGDGIYYDFGVLTRKENMQVAQADIINGGDGDDTIYGGGSNDVGAVLHGDAGNDFIQTARGKAYGDEGSDRLVGNGNGYELYGGAGADRMDMMSSGFADGGEGSDVYNVNSRTPVYIQDTGSSGIDVVMLKNIETFNDVVVKNDGVSVYIFSKANWDAGNLDSGVVLSNWYAGGNTIESFQTNNGDSFTIS